MNNDDGKWDSVVAPWYTGPVVVLVCVALAIAAGVLGGIAVAVGEWTHAFLTGR
jgi:hypothetical protein